MGGCTVDDDIPFEPVVRKPKRVLEKTVERRVVERAKAAGSIAYKFTSPGRPSVPDRLILSPVPPEHREIVARYVRFTEVKRPGGKPTPAQLREHEFLRGLGFQVDVVDE